jgi:hypothetical protein
LSNLDIAQGHANVFVPEQLHESGKADAEADHLGGIGVAKLVRGDRTGAGPSLTSIRKGFPKTVIQRIAAAKTRE